MTTHHDYTQHGYPCCNLVAVDPPPLIRMCGGPGYRCDQCNLDAEMVHALRPFKAPDDTRAADYLAGQKHQRAELCCVIRGWLHLSRAQRDELTRVIEALPYPPRPAADDD